MDNQSNSSLVSRKIGLTKGLIVDSSRTNEKDLCVESINMQFDSGIGEARLRSGSTKLGTIVGITPILGLYEFKS